MSQAELILDDTAIAEAEAALAALAEEYPAYAQSDVDQMARLSTDILEGVQRGEDTAGDLASLYAIAHNVKGQGSSFGYELMTLLGEALCQQLRHASCVDLPGACRLVAVVRACGFVLAERLTGLGGLRGRVLLAELGLAVP